MNFTQALIIGVIVVLLTYDVFAGKLGQPTESAALRDWARKWVSLPWCAGFLSGHWFAPQRQLWGSGWMLALPILIVLVAFDVYWNVKEKSETWFRYPLLYVGLGILCGVFLWGQPY